MLEFLLSKEARNRFSPWINVKMGKNRETKSHIKSNEMKTGLNWWFTLGGNITKRPWFYLIGVLIKKLIQALMISTNIFGCLKNVFGYLKLSFLVAKFTFLSCKWTSGLSWQLSKMHIKHPALFLAQSICSILCRFKNSRMGSIPSLKWRVVMNQVSQFSKKKVVVCPLE